MDESGVSERCGSGEVGYGERRMRRGIAAWGIACVALAFASITKSWLLKRELGAPVSGWRWDLAWATAAGIVVGAGVRYLLPETWQLILGVPAILAAFFSVLWTKGFGPDDRELFRLKKDEVKELREAEEAAEARDQVGDSVV